MDPWGTPDVTWAQLDVQPSSKTLYLRVVRNDFIQLSRDPLIPMQSSFIRRRSWGTLSNVLEKSRKMACVDDLLSKV